MASLIDSEYKIITVGGRENGPLDTNTIHGLFTRGLVNKDTLVLVPSTNEWKPLGVVFDLAEWEKSRPKDRPAAKDTSGRRLSSLSPSSELPRAYQPKLSETLAPWLIGLGGIVVVGSLLVFLFFTLLSAKGSAEVRFGIYRGIFFLGGILLFIVGFVTKHILDDRKFKRELAQLDREQEQLRQAGR